MRRQLTHAGLVLLLFLGSCIQTKLLQYSSTISDAVKIKNLAVSEFELFDLRHQLTLMQKLSMDRAVYQEEIAAYRTRRSVLLDQMQQQFRREIDMKTLSSTETDEMVMAANYLLISANQLSQTVKKFIDDETNHIKRFAEESGTGN